MKRLSQRVAELGWEVIAVTLAIVLAGLASVPHAQSVWNDVRHEVTLRNDPQAFSCTVVNNAGTTLAALGGSCTSTQTGTSLYITDVVASASAAGTTTADQFLELKSGTGTNCATGTAVVWAAYNAAVTPVVATLTTPIKVGPNLDLCWMDAVTGSKTFIVNGYIK